MEYTLENVKNKQYFVDSYHFSHNGVNVLLDVNNSNFYSVEPIYCDIADYLSTGEVSANQIREKYNDDQIQEALSNLIEFGLSVKKSQNMRRLPLRKIRKLLTLL